MNARTKVDAPAGRKPAIVVQASAEYRDWLGRLADHCRMPASVVVDAAVARFAREVGFAEPPRR